MSLLKQTLEALATLGDHKTFPDILLNRFDHQLALVCHFVEMKKVAESEHDLQTPEIQALVQQYKDNLRVLLQRAVDELAHEHDRISKADTARIRRELLKAVHDSNKPHHLGTVAELAAKYGVSKSEIRRRKRDGTLNELIEGAQQ